MGQLSFEGSASHAARECSEKIRCAIEWHRRWLYDSVRLSCRRALPSKIGRKVANKQRQTLTQRLLCTFAFAALRSHLTRIVSCRDIFCTSSTNGHWNVSHADDDKTLFVIIISHNNNKPFPFSCLSRLPWHTARLRVRQSKSRVKENHRRYQHILLDGRWSGASLTSLALLQDQDLQRLHRCFGQLSSVSIEIDD